MAENVFVPIGMLDTVVRISPHQIVAGRAQGYLPGDGAYLEMADAGGLVGASAVPSTVGDLQRWVENLASGEVGGRALIDELTTERVLPDGTSTDYSYGLRIVEHRGLKRVHHGGSGIGFQSEVVFYPEIGAGVTVQSNAREFDGDVAFRLAEAFFAGAMDSESDSGRVAEEEPEPRLILRRTKLLTITIPSRLTSWWDATPLILDPNSR